jgi:hypothetical protein
MFWVQLGWQYVELAAWEMIIIVQRECHDALPKRSLMALAQDGLTLRLHAREDWQEKRDQYRDDPNRYQEFQERKTAAMFLMHYHSSVGEPTTDGSRVSRVSISTHSIIQQRYCKKNCPGNQCRRGTKPK